MAWSFNLTTGPYGSAHRSCRPLRRPVAVAADIAGEAGQPAVRCRTYGRARHPAPSQGGQTPRVAPGAWPFFLAASTHFSFSDQRVAAPGAKCRGSRPLETAHSHLSVTVPIFRDIL